MKLKAYIRFTLVTVLLIGGFYACTGKQNMLKTGLDDSTVMTIGSKRHIDMSQFKETRLNIPYAGTDNVRQTLDIVYPSRGQAPYKTIVLIHGGGWLIGNKETESIASVFQATTQGYAIVSINYRLSNEVRWPEPLHDAKAAIRFIRANAEQYRLDTEKLVAWGESAGGHIGEMLGATNGRPEFEDPAMGNPNISSAVQGIVAWYPISDVGGLTDTGTLPADAIMGYDVRANKEKNHDANPIDLVTKDFPPLLLVHGTTDAIVPYQQSLDMQKKVKEQTGIEPHLLTFLGAAHGDARIKSTENVIINLRFVDKILYGGKNPYRNTNFIIIKTAD